MIIAVSIIDKHKAAGHRHVGTYHFEVDYPGESHFDLMAVPCPTENERLIRPLLGRLLTKAELVALGAVDGNGSEIPSQPVS